MLDFPEERQALADSLPDDLPGQSNCGAADACFASFPEPPPSSAAAAAATTAGNTAQWRRQPAAGAGRGAADGGAAAAPDVQRQQGGKPAGRQGRSPLNEVVVGAMMAAYEHAGQVDKV